ncbi:MAG: drug/metabolite transporter (DMT)-like permease, partial [Paracoccaceae bacterium]
PFGWVAVSGSLLFWLIISEFLGGLAHIAATEAAARAPVAVLAPFEFTGLLWALGFDIVYLHDLPRRAWHYRCWRHNRGRSCCD